MLLGDGRFNIGSAAPKASRINPLSGLKRIFGVQGLIELGKGLVKLALLGGIAWWWATGRLPGLLRFGTSPLAAQIALASEAVTSLVGTLLIGLLVIAGIDYPLQRFQRDKRLKMSLQDMRDENKESEGSPEMKSARRQRQRDLARGGVARAMKDAQFVIVNPLHFAVALTYDPARAPAPLLLAKGRGETALAGHCPPERRAAFPQGPRPARNRGRRTGARRERRRRSSRSPRSGRSAPYALHPGTTRSMGTGGGAWQGRI
jgi:flagellar biosynthetic protein FlhB